MIRYSTSAVIAAKPGCSWADTMVLNPAIFTVSGSSRLHMLFRATGPWPQKRLPGKHLPYPIFLGYAFSDDRGETWVSDFSRPALAPMLGQSKEELLINNVEGGRVVNYSNGCLEDPRVTVVEGEYYMTLACRMFPPGPYWDESLKINTTLTYRPDWAQEDNELGKAAQENLTVTVLYKIFPDRLIMEDYEHAFAYVTHLSDPEVSDNRDMFLFPERLTIQGCKQYVCVHRPLRPEKFTGGKAGIVPSIFLSAADKLADFPTAKCRHQLLAEPLFEWEGNRIGGSFPPIKICENEWLLGYHGKKDNVMGYTQSFMILRQENDEFPRVVHRCSERLMYAKQKWEFSDLFTVPCLFSCSGVVVNDTLIIGYGAGDERVGVAWVDLAALVAYVKKYDKWGNEDSAGAFYLPSRRSHPLKEKCVK
jgi:predicted GH43/DUF377 family glycosyl hydrolase